MPKLQNVAQTSQYVVKFQLPVSSLRSYLRRKGVNDRFIADDIGLLCSDAVLPGSALASVDTRGDFQGVIERFAHTRNFTQINFCLLYTSPSPRDRTRSRMPSSA